MGIKHWRGNIQEQMNCIFNTDFDDILKEEIDGLTEEEAKGVLFKTVKFAKPLIKETAKYREVKEALYFLKEVLND